MALSDVYVEVAAVGIQGLGRYNGASGASGASYPGATGPTGATGSGSALTVSNITGATGGATGSITNEVTGVTALRFDRDTGFLVDNLGSGEVKVSLGSAFKYIQVDGQETLVAVAEDTLKINAGSGISITTDHHGSPQSLTISATGASGAGTPGATGSRGLTGASGVAGASGTASGGVATWTVSSTYNQYDIVSFQGLLYYWNGPGSGNSGASPNIDTSYWTSTSSNGATGVQGATGRSGTGPQGASGIGATGSQGPRGFIGQQGATGPSGLQQNLFTTSTTDQTLIDILDVTEIRSVKYDMQVTSNDQYYVSEIRLLHDNSHVYLTEYGSLGTPLGDFASYYSPITNNYSSPKINTAAISKWENNTLTVYSSDEETQLALDSILETTLISLNSGAVTVTLASKMVETSPGIFQGTTVESRSPLLLVSNIAWTGTGYCELRFTPYNAITTIQYTRSIIPSA
jgi:hypothetical protein